MSADLEKEIAACLDLKEGNKEFALFLYGDGSWVAMIGNTCLAVSLGESVGEFEAYGKTAMEAVLALKEQLQQ